MISTESLVIFVIVAAMIGAVAYYFYKKTSSQEELFNNLIEKVNTLEVAMMRPPMAEIESVFEKPELKRRQQIARQQYCDESACYFEPPPRDTGIVDPEVVSTMDGKELDLIADEELAQLEKKVEEKKAK